MTDQSPNGRGDGRPASRVELLRRLTGDVSALLRSEAGLVSATLGRSAKRVVGAVVLLAVAGTLALACVGALTAMAVLVLAIWLPGWAAALIIAAAIAATAGLMAAIALKLLRRGLIEEPREAVDSVRRNVAWLRGEVDAASSGRTEPAARAAP